MVLNFSSPATFRKPPKASSAAWSVRPWEMTALRKWRKGPWLILRYSRSWVTQPCAWSWSKCRRTHRHLASKFSNFQVNIFKQHSSNRNILFQSCILFDSQPPEESSYCPEDPETHWCWTDSHTLIQRQEPHVWRSSKTTAEHSKPSIMIHLFFSCL